MNFFKLEVIVPVPALGAIMEHVLTTPHARVLDCGVVPIERKPSRPKAIAHNGKAKKHRSSPQIDAATAIVMVHVAQVNVGDAFPIKPVRTDFTARVANGQGPLWKAINRLIDDGVIRRGQRGAYVRLR